MSNIKLLDQNTINQIAAGEVIDRPALMRVLIKLVLKLKMVALNL